MTPDELARGLAALPSLEMRTAKLCEVIEKTAAKELAPVLEEIIRQGRVTGPPYRVALIALSSLASDEQRISYEAGKRLYQAARDRGFEALAGLLLSSPAAQDTVAETERALRPGGRPLTLGERKSLARAARGENLARLLRDTNPHVIRPLLLNPRLTEKDVITIAALRPQHPDSLRAVARSQRWISRQSVRRALAFNPHTPQEITVRLLTLIGKKDLKSIAVDASLSEKVRSGARTLLRTNERVATPSITWSPPTEGEKPN